MTLNTKFRVLDPVIPPEGPFLGLHILVGGSPGDDHVRTPNGIHNEPGRGLHALISSHWGMDGPLPAEDGAPEAFVELEFDTPYLFEHPTHGKCGDFHVWIVETLGTACEHFGYRWAWCLEDTGEWFTGREGLEKLHTHAAESADWVKSSVIPSITLQGGKIIRLPNDAGVEMASQK